jgi:hypothetical protein
MLKKVSIVIALVLLLAGCATCKDVAKKGTDEQGEPPVILDSYASESIRPGANWRVYLKAQDADGDMKYIVAELWQAGVGYYTNNFTYIKGADREGFAGYLVLRTPSDTTLIGDEFILMVLVRDCQGNKAEPIYLPLTFDYGAPQGIPEGWETATNRRLGNILIDIESSHRYNSGAGANFLNK